MRVEQLSLRNFRGFDELALDFDPAMTVVLGENMAGKSAVLEAVATGISGFFYTAPVNPGRVIEASDVRRVVHVIGGVPDLQAQLPATVEVHAVFDGTRFHWVRSREDLEFGEGDQDVTKSGGLVALAREIQRGKALDLPLIAYYGTRRGWRGDAFAFDEPSRGIGTRYDGYVDCFDITSSHAALSQWMRKQTYIQLQRGAGSANPQLDAVSASVSTCIEGVVRFWFDLQFEELRLERAGGDVQSFSMLSEGYRNVVAMVADIAWRAAVLNPHHGALASRETVGVVLIDELDLHLHPAWQRRIVADLRRTFPRMQFIVTTHSPQIVASVGRSQVRVLKNNKLVADNAFVEGRDTNELLEDVFDVPARPAKVQEEIDAMFRSIEDEDYERARGQLEALQDRLGADDASMIRARWILEAEDAEGRQSPPVQ